MKIPESRSHFHRGGCIAVLSACFVASLATTHAASPSLQPLRQGKWPPLQRGVANDVKVIGNYAYVALGPAGLAVFDVSTPSNCVRLAGYDTSDYAYGVALSGNYAYVADNTAGLHVIDVRNPTNCVRVGGIDTVGWSTTIIIRRWRQLKSASDIRLRLCGHCG